MAVSEVVSLSERMRAMRAMKPMVPKEDRFWSKVEPEPNSGCWIWIGARTEGYGQLSSGRREEGNISAHRFAYVLLRGPIPVGFEPDHLCRLRCCVNPWHMEPVTRRENALRGLRGRLRRRSTEALAG